ncbi:MAG: hypothetical protein KatS3mg123_0713 [Burkholderiales bacterium]|nr:MAG: hypothetical protein KatS3mg123_0713 [Burkholderiales bacterium]
MISRSVTGGDSFRLIRSLFWVALAQIVMINILLSGDNAVVIALASRNLPARSSRSRRFCSAASAPSRCG